MDPKKYNPSITLNCPTCGGIDFAPRDDESLLTTCTNCGLEVTMDDLTSRNHENIQAHVEELKKTILTDFEKQLKKSLTDALRGSKNIKIK